MKAIRFGFLILVAALAVIGTTPPAVAFHSGGVGECVGCHSMHAPASAPLLVKGDQSSTCLNCHEQTGLLTPSSYHISTAPADMPNGVPPRQRTPGGDFGWLKKSYNTTASFGAAIVNDGNTHGHNIVATDYTYIPDPTNATAPGGDMNSALLGCASCHDPHGRARRLPDGSIVNPAPGSTSAPIYASGSTGATPPANFSVGVYRILGADGYTAYGTVEFGGVPAAVVPSGYNRTESATQTRVAYGHGTANGYTSWGNWCATCHPDMHSSAGYVHPVDQALGTDVTNNYNAYVKSGDLGGSDTTSFSSLVPFSEDTADIATLLSHARNNDTVLNGPTAADRVSCLSCHRAHASAWDYGLRWNPEGEFLTMGDSAGNPVYPATDAVGNAMNSTTALSAYGQFHRGYSTTEMAAAYYDRPATKFAAYQRALCNKCHAQD